MNKIPFHGNGWLYCFRTHGFTDSQIPIYKVGFTTTYNPLDVLEECDGANRCKKFVYCEYFSDKSVAEYILRKLRIQENVEVLRELGIQYFSCVNDIVMRSTVKLLANEWECEGDVDECDEENYEENESDAETVFIYEEEEEEDFPEDTRSDKYQPHLF